jgi:transcriptional regulator with GAF, ATPase, and Fis domain
LESGFWQVLFLDRRLPDLDAEELSHAVRQRFPGIEVVMLDPSSDGELATEETNNQIPSVSSFSPDSSGAENGDWSADHSTIATPRHDLALPGMIGDSQAMQPVYRLVHLLAPRNTTVLITGPTGCGKEILARAIHQLSPRAARTFEVVNCAAIPETMLEAELFGYARGAFTGAMQAYAGRIQAAQGGTLFLDEIGEMPLSLQPKLLRFLEQKELQRLGSSEVVRVDARGGFCH